MDQVRGSQSIVFSQAPYIISAASVAGSKEAEGPLAKLFDMVNQDDLFGAQTWEEAESNMQKEACTLALGKAHVKAEKVRYLFGGDLLPYAAVVCIAAYLFNFGHSVYDQKVREDIVRRVIRRRRRKKRPLPLPVRLY